MAGRLPWRLACVTRPCLDRSPSGGVWFKYSEVYRAWVQDALGDEASPEVDTARLALNHPGWVAWLNNSTDRTEGSHSWFNSSRCGQRH